MVVMRCELGHVRNRSISCLLVVFLWTGSVIWFRYHLRHSRFWFVGITAGCDGVASRTGRFALCEGCCVLVEHDVGWAELPVRMVWRREQFCSFAGNRTMKMGVSRHVIPQVASTLLSNTSIRRTQLLWQLCFLTYFDLPWNLITVVLDRNMAVNKLCKKLVFGPLIWYKALGRCQEKVRTAYVLRSK